MAAEITFTAASDRPSHKLVHGLETAFRVHRLPRQTTRRTYLDTFDWRLYRDGDAISAEKRGGEWLLRWRSLDGAARRRIRTGQLPAFAWDVDGAEAREELARVIGVRRLLPVVDVETRSDELAILGPRDKTVVRVHVERGHATAPQGPTAGRPMPERVRVSPVRGYDAEHAAVVSHLRQALGAHGEAGCELRASLAAIGARPASYSPKLDLRLEPEMRAVEAVTALLLRLARTMRDNEDGTRRDLDAEFLHDFRVATRRTRSCLGQLEGVLDEDASARFGREFAWLGEVTGPTRDLDVFLLALPRLAGMIPEEMRGDLTALESFLRERKTAEQARVADALGSGRYRSLVREWPAYLDAIREGKGPALPPEASRPVLDLASDRIRRAYRRVSKRGRRITREASPDAIHRLRISCKKLRYLLEFFRSLYPRREISGPIRALKRLQDGLGEFNDLAVQKDALVQAAEEMHRRGDAHAGTLLATGCLKGALHSRQLGMTDRILESVEDFVRDHGPSFRELFR